MSKPKKDAEKQPAVAPEAAVPEPAAEIVTPEPTAEPEAEVEANPDLSVAPAAEAVDELEEVDLVIGEDGLAGLEMLSGLSGPEISLAPGDPHRCPVDEAIRLVRAGLAKAA